MCIAKFSIQCDFAFLSKGTGKRTGFSIWGESVAKACYNSNILKNQENVDFFSLLVNSKRTKQNQKKLFFLISKVCVS